jgi:hypothetical protein
MAWRSITEKDLLTRISAGELQSIRTRAEAEDMGDIIAQSVTNVTEKIRGFVAGNSSNAIDAAPDTIPSNLIDAAVAILVVDIYSRSGGILVDINETRTKASDSAERTLREAASGSFAVSKPEGTPSQDYTQAASAELASRSSPLRREEMKGL